MKPVFAIGIGAVLFLVILGSLYYGLFILRGLTVTSWWRSPWHNKEVGGVANSLHMVGLAWDIIPASAENYSFLKSLGLTVIDEADHLHAQL